MVKNFMDSLPPELEDAFAHDGCTDIGVFSELYRFPNRRSLHLPVFRCGSLEYVFQRLIFLPTRQMDAATPGQTLVADSSSTGVGQATIGGDEALLPQETIRMASIVLAILPILVGTRFCKSILPKGSKMIERLTGRNDVARLVVDQPERSVNIKICR